MDGFGQGGGRVRQRAHALYRILDIALVIEQRVHEGRSHDDAIGVLADGRALLRGGNADADAHVLRTGCTGTRHKTLRRRVDRVALAGHTHA